jgi:hypothetical protein
MSHSSARSLSAPLKHSSPRTPGRCAAGTSDRTLIYGRPNSQRATGRHGRLRWRCGSALFTACVRQLAKVHGHCCTHRNSYCHEAML